MNPNLELKPPTAPNAEKRKLVPLFEIFVDQEFGGETWDVMMEDEVVSKLIDEIFPKYGDSIFPELVNKVAEIHNISIKTILEKFSAFVNTYY